MRRIGSAPYEARRTEGSGPGGERLVAGYRRLQRRRTQVADLDTPLALLLELLREREGLAGVLRALVERDPPALALQLPIDLHLAADRLPAGARDMALERALEVAARRL